MIPQPMVNSSSLASSLEPVLVEVEKAPSDSMHSRELGSTIVISTPSKTSNTPPAPQVAPASEVPKRPRSLMLSPAKTIVSSSVEKKSRAIISFPPGTLGLTHGRITT